MATSAPPTRPLPAPARPAAIAAAPRPDDVLLSLSGVGKVYRLYDRPQDRLKHMLFSRFGHPYGREFCALQGVDLDVRRGEVIGIIGRNGSGKSTLLQIMAGILQPASGVVRTSGRVGCLLELGSGFNPECTGRENIFINGAILGLPPQEIERRLDRIVAFADIGEFIDQPVKTFSSGMFVRLAFAVTTSLDADVLLIDEALAVGDVFFRQKCYQRLEELRARGVAIVLVSHAMNEVEQFCQRALLLHGGRVLFHGPAIEAVKRYYLIQPDAHLAVGAPELPLPAPAAAPSGERLEWPAPDAFLDLSRVAQASNGLARCTAAALCDAEGRARRLFDQGETARFFFEWEILADIEVPTAGVELVNDKGTIVHGKSTLEHGTEVPAVVRRGERLRLRQDIALAIAPGEYTFNVGLGTIGQRAYAARAAASHAELDAAMTRLCLLPTVGALAVTFRARGAPVQLLHHGAADLPGESRVSVVGP